MFPERIGISPCHILPESVDLANDLSSWSCSAWDHRHPMTLLQDHHHHHHHHHHHQPNIQKSEGVEGILQAVSRNWGDWCCLMGFGMPAAVDHNNGMKFSDGSLCPITVDVKTCVTLPILAATSNQYIYIYIICNIHIAQNFKIKIYVFLNTHTHFMFEFHLDTSKSPAYFVGTT